MSDRCTVGSTKITQAAVEVLWVDDHKSRYHHMWLRDNRMCAACGTHACGSRFQKLLDIPDSIVPLRVEVVPPELVVTWVPDGHTSRFDLRWLRNSCYSDVERTRRGVKRTLWDSSIAELPEVDYRAVLSDRTELRRLFASVREYGFAFVRKVGTAVHEIERLAGMLGYIRETHYGRVFDLVVREDLKILADMPGAILPHSDETYRHVPTGINIFHCIEPSPDMGGMSTLVDSFTVANQLQKEDPVAFALLSRVPIQHERRVPQELIRSNNPVFTRDCEGDLIEVRLNERTMSALSLPEELMESVYRALRKTFRIAYDPANRIQRLLHAGEALVFDNLRVLHGRTEFNGKRFLRQTQVMRDEFYARLSALEEDAAKKDIDWVAE